MNLVKLDYASRGLDICQFCGCKYNVGERIPRILVNCGHTFCTHCLSKLFRKNRVRCPLCKKLIKNLETVERLPLNINILYEVVENDPILAKVNFEFEDEEEEEMESKLCEVHNDRVKHFYCSNHQSIFCRECIKTYHIEEACFVVDLYEIQKMRQLQRQNITHNEAQAKNRAIKS